FASQGELERQRLKATAAAALLGFFLTVGVVAWREYRFRRLDSAHELTQDLGMNVVGTLPSLPSATRALLPWRKVEAETLHGLWTESIDATRTSLLHTAR